MDLILNQFWQGLPAGYRLVAVPIGQAELMIARGLANAADTRASDRADNRAGDTERSKKTTRNRK
jgi:hypothetical protein